MVRAAERGIVLGGEQMKEKKLYTCEICHTDYADKNRCRECEKSHNTNLQIKTLGKYKPIGVCSDGFPYSITVSTADGKREYTYHR